MNKVYRLVWNASRNAWIVACEYAFAHGKTGTVGAVSEGEALIGPEGDGSLRVMAHPATPIGAILTLTAALMGGGMTGDAEAAPGLFVNDSDKVSAADQGCIRVLDNGTASWVYDDSGNMKCDSGDKASQTGRVLFYGSGTQTGSNSLTLGNELFVNGGRLGLNNRIAGDNSMAIGNVADSGGTTALGLNAMAIGNNAHAAAIAALALGTGATASQEGSVALGSGSQTAAAVGTPGATIAGTAYNFAGTNPTSTVSVGAVGAERTLTNVAAGRISDTSTDAINGSQLHATNEAINLLDQNAVKYDLNPNGTINYNSITLGGDIYDSSTHTGGTTITNVANGVADSDAVNVAQLNDLANTPMTFTGNAGTVDRKLGETLAIQGESATASTYSGANLRTEVDASGNLQLLMAENPVFNSVITGNTMLDTNGLTISGGPSVTINGIDAGSQKITNVAAGDISASSTDAINGSQLYETNQNITNIANGTMGPVQRTGTDMLSLIADGRDASAPGNAQVLTNVADGAVNATSADAINGSQLYGLAESTANALGGGSTVNADGSITAPTYYVDGSTVNNVGAAITNIDGRVTQNTTNITTLQQDALQWNAALGAYDASHGTADPQKISNVAAGTDSTDAVNVSQLKGEVQAATANAVMYDNSSHSTVTLNPGGNAVTITNLADGVNLSDAVNMSQLTDLANTPMTFTGNDGTVDRKLGDTLIIKGEATTAGTYSGSNLKTVVDPLTGIVSLQMADAPKFGDITINDNGKITGVAAGDVSAGSTDAVNGSQLFEVSNQVNTINNGGGIKYFHANSNKADSVASGAESVAVGPNAQASGAGSMAIGDESAASGIGSVAIGQGSSASANGSVALGQGASDGGRGAESYVGKYSNAQNDTVGTVSVGNAATGETRTISNVADGKLATDAVNLRQLDGAVAESKQYTDDSINQVNTAVTNVDNRVTNVEGNVNRIDTYVTNIDKGTEGMFQVNNTSNRAHPRPTGQDATAGGAGAVASANNSTAIGSNARATADNSVAVGANSVADRANSVSVGSAGNERQITNLAAGTSGTDAVNLDQLNRSVSGGVGQANAYTDARYNDLKDDLNQQDDTLSAGIAGAMAMASLPQPYEPGASMAAAGVSGYRGQSAISVGVSRISDNGKWVTKLQGSADSQGEVGIGVGVGYQW